MGWDIDVELKDRNTSWMDLRELNKYRTLNLTRYEVDNQVMGEPDFDW